MLSQSTMQELRSQLEARRAEIENDVSFMAEEMRSIGIEQDDENGSLGNHIAEDGASIAEAERIKAEVVTLKEKLKALKKADGKPTAIEALETQIREQEKLARESQAKADAIGASVFDLKAVNPNAVVKLDTRTPAEVIQSIEDQGAVVAKSLATLRALLQR